MRVTRECVSAYAQLPAEIRARHRDMFGWEYVKESDGSRWWPTGYNVITPDGIHTYTLGGLMVRDRVLYA